jgi:hypothetical protein
MSGSWPTARSSIRADGWIWGLFEVRVGREQQALPPGEPADDSAAPHGQFRDPLPPVADLLPHGEGELFALGFRGRPGFG